MNLSIVKQAQDGAQEKSPWMQYINAKELVANAPSIVGLSKEQLFGPSRRNEYCQPRFIVMLALSRMGLSHKQVALLTGRTDHTTSIHGVNYAKKLVAQYKDYQQLLDALEAAI